MFIPVVNLIAFKLCKPYKVQSNNLRHPEDNTVWRKVALVCLVSLYMFIPCCVFVCLQVCLQDCEEETDLGLFAPISLD